MRYSSSLLDLNRSYQNMPLNVLKNDKGYVFEFIVPGFKQEELNVIVEDRNLILKAEPANEDKGTKQKYSQRSFGFGNLTKKLRLPEHVDVDGLSAKLAQGILKVELPFDSKKHVVRTISIN